MALEQPGLRLWGRPGLLSDSAYLERFGFIPSPKTVRTDAETLRRYGFVKTDAKTEPAPESVAGLKPLPADNIDGLPVGFARMTNVTNPGTGEPDTRQDRADLRGLPHRKHPLQGRQRSLRRRRIDAGIAQARSRDRSFRSSTRSTCPAASIASPRACLAPMHRQGERAQAQDRAEADRRVPARAGEDYLNAVTTKTIKAKRTGNDTDEGYGRLDALNRIGNQVFYTDLAAGGLSGIENNLYANDAPVSYPPIWTVPWLWWAQYDASIEQPLIRNAGEALGVSALVNLSPEHCAGQAVPLVGRAGESRAHREDAARLRSLQPQPARVLRGLKSPKWPSHLFPDDAAWKINPEVASRNGRKLYADICAECHLGPVNDPEFDTQYPDKSFWKSDRWKQDKDGGWVLDEVQKSAKAHGHRSCAGDVLRDATGPGARLPQSASGQGPQGARWKCEGNCRPLFLDRDAVLDRADDRGRSGQPEMAGGSRHHRPASNWRNLGRAQQLSQSEAH